MAKVKQIIGGLVIILLITTIIYAAQDVNLVPLNNGIKQTIVTVTTSATTLPTTALSGRKSIIVKNLDTTDTIFLGDSAVTADEATTGGFPLAYYETFQGDIGEDTILYAISTASAKVAVFEAR